MHAQAVFCVIFKEGVGPCRSLAFGILCVRHGGGAGSVNGGAAGGIGNHHAVAEEAGHHIDVGCFAAACAGAGEFKVGRFELGASEVALAQRILTGREIHGVVPEVLLGQLGFSRLHDESLLGSGAGVGADAAAIAVFRVDDDAEFQAFHRASEFLHNESFRCFFRFFFCYQNRTDGGMGAYHGALVAFDTVFRNPFRNIDGSSRAFVLGCTGRECAVFQTFPGGNREIVPFLAVHDVAHVLDEIRTGHSGNGAAGGGVFPCCRDFHFFHTRHACVYGGIIHIHHVLAFSAVGFFIGILQVFHRIFIGNDVGEMEEGSLHDHVDTAAQADFLSDFKGVDNVEFRMEGSQFPLHGSRQYPFQIFLSPGGVQEENAAGLEAAEKVVFINVGRTVAGNVVSLADKVWFSDGVFAEAEVGNGDAAGFLGVIGEVALGIEVCVVADDFDGALVGAYGAVTAKAPEFAGNEFPRHFRYRYGSQGKAGDVVVDGKGEVMAWCFILQMFIHSHNIFRNHVLGAQAVASAAYFDGAAGGGDGGNHVQIERFADGAGFAGAVENGNLLYGLRNLGEEMLHREGAVQMDVKNAYLFAVGVQCISHVLADIGDRADGDDDAVRIRCAVVVEEVVASAGDFADFVHVVLDNVRQRIVEGVGCFAVLEVDIRVFSRAADDRMIRVESPGTECSKGLLVD